MDILISGLLLAGTYALIAMGLNLQYGVARIMNLANGEILVFGALAAFWLYVADGISPLLSLFIIAPAAFAGNWLIYRFLLLCRWCAGPPARALWKWTRSWRRSG